MWSSRSPVIGEGWAAKNTRRITLNANAKAARNPYPWACRANVSCSMPCWAAEAASEAWIGFDGFSLSNVGRNPDLGAGGLLELALRAMESLIAPTAGRADANKPGTFT